MTSTITGAMDSEAGHTIKTLGEVMNPSPLIVAESTPVLAALGTMRERRVSSVLVGTPSAPVGIVTERDVVRWLHQRLDLDDLTCGMVRHGPVVTLHRDVTYLEAHHAMVQRGIRHLGVTDDEDRVVGVVSETDILRSIGVEYFTQFKDVGSMMSRSFCAMPLDTSVEDAIARMHAERHGCVIVVDDEHRPVGVMTERDIVRLTVEGHSPAQLTLRGVASRPVKTVGADSLSHEAVTTMESLNIRRLVVVDRDGVVVGLLSQREVVGGLENHYVKLLKSIIDQQSRQIRHFDAPIDERSVLDSLLAASSDGITLLTDHDFVVLAANPRAANLLGATAADIVGSELSGLFARFGTEAERSLAAIKLSGTGRMEVALSTPDRVLPVELRIERLMHPDRGAQGYLVTAVDLSEKHEASNALLAERDFSDAIIAGLPGLFYLMDLEGRLERWNTAWSRITQIAGTIPRRGALVAELLGLHDIESRAKLTAGLTEREVELELPLTGLDGDTRFFLHKLRRVDIGRRHYVIGTAIDITERKFSMSEAERMARIDTLTGLHNRHYFQESLRDALATSDGDPTRTALLFLDLDNFKDVNDTLGHVVGDNLLRAVASRLRRVARPRAALARLGGDEFALILNGDWEDGAPEALADSIITALGQPFGIDGHQVYIGASIGIVTYPGEFVEKSGILGQADMAMYRAKSGGRSRWCRFEPWMAIDVQRRRLIETELREAAEREQFELHYQPKLTLDSGVMTGAEALIRWRHPVLGLVAPDEFIPLAESTGDIAAIGEWVLRAACLEAARWRDAGHPLRIAVNVSPVQFLRHDVVAAIRGALEGAGLPGSLLEIEITENAVVTDARRTRALLEEITAMGVTVAMDDFGTGHSSLAQLKRLPFNTLKVDKSFVMSLDGDADARTIVNTIVTLGHALGMRVVAEGIETPEQLDILRRMGCDDGQGFHFWRPLPAQLFRDILGGL